MPFDKTGQNRIEWNGMKLRLAGRDCIKKSTRGGSCQARLASVGLFGLSAFLSRAFVSLVVTTVYKHSMANHTFF
jgi:hypothetical protein